MSSFATPKLDPPEVSATRFAQMKQHRLQPKKRDWSTYRPPAIMAMLGTASTITLFPCFLEPGPKQFSFDIMLYGINILSLTQDERDRHTGRWAKLYPLHRPDWTTLKSIARVDRQP